MRVLEYFYRLPATFVPIWFVKRKKEGKKEKRRGREKRERKHAKCALSINLA